MQKDHLLRLLLQTVVRRLLLDLPEDNFLLDAFRLVLELNLPLRKAAAVDPFLEDPFFPERKVDFFLFLLLPPPLSELRLLFTFPVLLFFLLILLLAILPLVFVFRPFFPPLLIDELPLLLPLPLPLPPLPTALSCCAFFRWQTQKSPTPARARCTE